MEITPADKDKRLIRLAAWWIRKKYKDSTNKNSIKEDMEACGNPAIKKMYDILQDISEEITEVYQKNTMSELTELVLWIMYKDTAYRQPFFYTLKKLFDMKDELMPLIEKYYEEPSEWFVNAWHDAKMETKKLKKEGKMANLNTNMSAAETYFVPSVQQDRFRKIEDDMKKRKRQRGW